ncbi:PHD finger protein PERSISTENT TAPETAL CELL like [Actinidia chinensis var. chinensis]|uniref:PHD finger protein PERSISTENT TAPETAL CELL like n=1 Tax=Actinidia chinensis var. chinensis TaxID=1590841 RepID=A0A2R6PGC6_ACTCC|nr:PHD finger protein PERSISTENT TAPETAL CELL like [Actinidia chinensis var. chinensis]
MDLRLIHGALDLGVRGSYGVTQAMYQKAIEAIQSMPLCLIGHHFVSANQEISAIISRYQALPSHSLAMQGDLFYFMLQLKAQLPKERCIDSYNPGILVESTSRWSPKRVEMATRVIVEALKTAEFRWVSRQEVRDAAHAYIGDTGLLDFMLKSLGNRIVGNYLVCRILNPVTKILGVQLTKNMFYLYKHILKEQKPTMTAGAFLTIQVASRIILDTKYLIKEYCGDLPSKQEAQIASESRINCMIVLRNDNHVDDRLKRVMAPYEYFKLNINATFDELKLQVAKSFRERDWGLKSFVEQSTLNLNAKGLDFVFVLVEVGGKVIFEGTNFLERGPINEDIFEGV